MSEGGLELPEALWTRLAIAWGLFFLFQGALNLWVAFHYSTETWVDFKLFGGMGLTIAFVVAQALWLTRALEAQPAKTDANES
jgi:intracellular septation protein